MSYTFPCTTHCNIVLVFINVYFLSNSFDSVTFSYSYIKTESLKSFSEQQNSMSKIVLYEELNKYDNKHSHLNFCKRNWYYLEDIILYIRTIQLENIIEKNNEKAKYQYNITPNSNNIERERCFLFYHMSNIYL